MKRVSILCLSLCLALASAAPALAEGSGAKSAVSIGGRVQAPGESVPLNPNEKLTMIMTAGNTGSRAYAFTITPPKEAVGGTLQRGAFVNLLLETCSPSLTFRDTTPQELNCTVRLQNTHREGHVDFKNQSRGVLMVSGGPCVSDASGAKKK